METKYPLCSALGVEIGRQLRADGSGKVAYEFVLAAELERILAAAPVVYGVPNAFFSHAEGESPGNGGPDTHTARLIAITPIVRDTAESLLRELCEAERTYRMLYQIKADGNIEVARAWDKMRLAADRARALLGDKGEGL